MTQFYSFIRDFIRVFITFLYALVPIEVLFIVDFTVWNSAQKATKHDTGFFILKLGEKLNKLKNGERFRQASHPTHTWKRENILEKKYT